MSTELYYAIVTLTVAAIVYAILTFASYSFITHVEHVIQLSLS